eukprot:755815-Hanusia_phi.AAC.9
MAGGDGERGDDVRLVLADFRTFEPCIVSERSAEEKRRKRRSLQASACGIVIASVAVLLLVSHHKGARTALTPEESITVTPEDIERLGLSAPRGFETPNIQVTAADIERLGLKAPAGFNVPSINVTQADIERSLDSALTSLGLTRVPIQTGVEASNSCSRWLRWKHTRYTPGRGAIRAGCAEWLRRCPRACDRFNLDVVRKSSSDTVQAEDVQRYGLIAPSGSRERDAIDVTDDDVKRYGLTLDPVTVDDIKVVFEIITPSSFAAPDESMLKFDLQAMGVAPIAVTDDDIDNLGLKLSKVTEQDKADMGLLGTTYRLTADEAAALGLSGPITLTAEEAVKLGLNVPSVTEGDLDK